jgi:hypothetical protein
MIAHVAPYVLSDFAVLGLLPLSLEVQIPVRYRPSSNQDGRVQVRFVCIPHREGIIEHYVLLATLPWQKI